MEPQQPLTREEAAALLAYADLTYRSVTSFRRRIATVALIVAVAMGVAFLVSAAQWVTTRSAIEQVADEPIIEGLGVRVPDPRPPLERAQLRIAALLWGVVAAGAAGMTLLAAGVYLVARPVGGLAGPRLPGRPTTDQP